MSQTINITIEDIFKEVKLSYQIPLLIKATIVRRVIANATAEAGFEVETEELQKAADELRLRNKLKSAENTWKWLQKYGMTLDDFEELVYGSISSLKLAEHLFVDKIEHYFYEHQLDYVGVVMYEVVLDDEELALELFYAIRESEMSFYDVAHKYIQDTELRRKGGYQGIVCRKDLQPEISAAVFAAKPPQVLKPIFTSRGVHLILVEEIIQPELDEKLHKQILSELFNTWLEQQVEDFEIVTHLESSIRN